MLPRPQNLDLVTVMELRAPFRPYNLDLGWTNMDLWGLYSSMEHSGEIWWLDLKSISTMALPCNRPTCNKWKRTFLAEWRSRLRPRECALGDCHKSTTFWQNLRGGDKRDWRVLEEEMQGRKRLYGGRNTNSIGTWCEDHGKNRVVSILCYAYTSRQDDQLLLVATGSPPFLGPIMNQHWTKAK